MNRSMFLVVLLILAMITACSAVAPTPELPVARVTTEPAQVIAPTRTAAPSRAANVPTLTASPVAPTAGASPAAPTVVTLPAAPTAPTIGAPPTASADPAFIATELLGRPTGGSVTVHVIPAQELEIYYEYGPAGGSATHQTPVERAAAGMPLETEITGLQPNMRYTYRLRYRPPGAEEFGAAAEGAFQTQRAPGSTFTFTLQADSHLDSSSSLAVYEQTLANVVADQPDFHLDLGDTFMTDTYEPVTAALQQYLAQRTYLSRVGRWAPLFLALGNHDGESGGPPGSAAEATAAWSAQIRTQYFPNPMPDGFYTGNTVPHESVGLLQNYYAWTWGDALFVVLDPHRYTTQQSGNWSHTLGLEQVQWLQHTLETSQAQYKFVFTHRLVGGIGSSGHGGAWAARFFEWGGYNLDGSWGFDEHRPAWDRPIHQLFVDHRVTAIFSGHDHIFARDEVDGVVYIRVPQPSSAQYYAAPNVQDGGDSSVAVLGSPGHVRVVVSPREVRVEYVRAHLPDETGEHLNGNVDYATSIAASRPASP